MCDQSPNKVRISWSPPDRWQVILSILSLLVAVAALLEQVGR